MPSGKNIFQRVGRRLACSNARFDVYFDALRTPSGHSVSDFLIVRPKVLNTGMIAGIAVLPECEGRIGLMRTFRHQFDEDIWQAPAGFVEDGETAAEAALRELSEETGLACPLERLVPLGLSIPDAGIIEAKVALFVARGAVPITRVAAPEVEPGAGALEFFSRAELASLIDRSAVIGSSTLVACYRYLALVQKTDGM